MNYQNPKPVVLVAFTPLRMGENSTWNLPHILEVEEAMIKQTFHPEAIKEDLEFVFIDDASRDDLQQQLEKYLDRMILFHYTGLSEMDGFDNGDYFFKILGSAPNLQLIYLHSYQINHAVDDLLNQGVQSIIAINSANNEDLTSKFTEHFYLHLGSGSTLQTSFEAAEYYVTSEYDSRFRFKIYPDVRAISDEQFRNTPRALYLNNGSMDLLDWKLPIIVEESADTFQPFIPDHYESNDFMVEVLQELASKKSSLYKFYREESFNKRERLNLIVKQYPLIIGQQLQRLEINNEEEDNFTSNRLESIVSVYSVIGQFLYYVLLANLWKIGREKTDRPPFRRGQFKIKEEINPDYFEALEPLLNGFREADIPLFIPELTDFLSNINVNIKKEQAFLHLRQLNSRIIEGQTGFDNIKKECIKAEYALSILLKEISFLINYHYIYTEEILITGKPQGIDYTIKYKQGTISENTSTNTLTANVGLAPQHFLIIKDLKNTIDHLNLTPFVIHGSFFEDEPNEDNLAYLCVFKEGDNYYYLNCYDSWYNINENPNLKKTADRRSMGGPTYDFLNMDKSDRLRQYLDRLSLDL